MTGSDTGRLSSHVLGFCSQPGSVVRSAFFKVGEQFVRHSDFDLFFLSALLSLTPWHKSTYLCGNLGSLPRRLFGLRGRLLCA